MTRTSPARRMARIVCLAASAALLCVSCAAPDVENMRQFSSENPRIVSLNPCLDAILVEIAPPDQVLALSHYSRDPASSSITSEDVDKFGTTGGTVEEILALDPDIVVASRFMAPATRAALDRLGVTVEVFDSPKTLEESLAQIKRLGKLTGRTRQSRALNARIMRDVPFLAPSVMPGMGAGPHIDTLLWQAGEIVPGEATLVWEHMARFGFTNHAAHMGLDQADHVSLERVLANPPELLLVAGDAAGQTHPLLNELKDTRTARFDPKLFYCGGPSMPKAWERLEQIQLTYVMGKEGAHHGHDHGGHNHTDHDHGAFQKYANGQNGHDRSHDHHGEHHDHAH